MIIDEAMIALEDDSGNGQELSWRRVLFTQCSSPPNFVELENRYERFQWSSPKLKWQ